MKKCIILLRVSTLQQDYEQQKADLIEYSKELGYDDYTFIADKESGIKLSEEERLGLIKLKQLVSDDQTYKAVIIWEITRLARTTSVLYSMKEWFENNHINLHIFDKRYTLINEDGTVDAETELLFSMYSYFASAEMKAKKIRMKRGKKAKKESGKFLGGTITYGYTWDKKTKQILINEEEKQVVIDIFQKYITTDLTIHKLGKEYQELGTFGKKSLSNTSSRIGTILRNKQYIGEDDGGLICPQIIPKEWFIKAQEKGMQSKKMDRCSKNIYYGKSLLKSYINGNRLRTNIGNYSYEIREPEYMNVRMDVVDALLWNVASMMYYPIIILQADGEHITQMKNQIETNIKKIENLQKQIITNNEELARLNNLYVKGRITEQQYEIEYNKKIDEIKTTETRIQELNAIINNLNITISNLEETKGVNINTISEIEDDEKRIEIIKQSIKEVIVTKIKKEHFKLHFKSTNGLENIFLINNRTKQIKELINNKENILDIKPLERFNSKQNIKI